MIEHGNTDPVPRHDTTTTEAVTVNDDSGNDGIQRYVGLASGLTRSTIGLTERMLAQFVRQGEVAAEHAERLLDEVVARSVEGGGALAKLVRAEVVQAVEQVIDQTGTARTEDVSALRDEVAGLRADVAQLRADLAARGVAGRAVDDRTAVAQAGDAIEGAP